MDENNKDDVIKNDNNNIETNDQTIEKTETNVVKEEQSVQKQDIANNNNTTANQQQKDKKGFSIAALVLGIVAIVLCCIWYISIPCGILAVIFGILGIKSSKKGMLNWLWRNSQAFLKSPLKANLAISMLFPPRLQAKHLQVFCFILTYIDGL